MPSLVPVAAIAGAFGVHGQVRLKPFTETPEGCIAYGPLLDADGNTVLTPASHRSLKAGLAVSAPEIPTREAAEALKGTLLHVPRDALPEPDADEFYFTDLVGLDVKTADGRRAGTVVAVHDFGASDMLEIKPSDASSYFHPFTREAVPKVDIPKRRLVIVPQEADD